MNWRRGLLLAGIHLAVALSLLAWEVSGSWRHIKSGQLVPLSTNMRLVAWQEGDLTVTFNPCADGGFVDGEMSPQERVSGMANLPVALLTGWHTPCTTQGYLGSMVETRLHRTRKSEIVIVAVLSARVWLEWFLVGGFPLIQPRQWWLEPGAFITVCTLIGTALTVVPYVAQVTVASASLAFLAWFWWFGLLVWKSVRASRRLVLRKQTATV